MLRSIIFNVINWFSVSKKQVIRGEEYQKWGNGLEYIFPQVLAMELRKGFKHPAQEDKAAELRDCGEILHMTEKKRKIKQQEPKKTPCRNTESNHYPVGSEEKKDDTQEN